MDEYRGGDHPGAAIIWVPHRVHGSDNLRRASSRRDVLDLIVILYVVDGVHSDRSWTPSKAQLAASWAAATAISADRAARYITAAITILEAMGFEAEPTSRPSNAQLALLARLLSPADPT